MTHWPHRTRLVVVVLLLILAAAVAVFVRRAVHVPAPAVQEAVKSFEDVNAAPAGPEAAAPANAPALLRVAMLPVLGRTTVLAEFTGPLPQAHEIEAADGTVAIEAGPVQPGVQARDLTAADHTTHVSRVSVRELSRSGGNRYVSLNIAQRGSADHHLRVSGSRLYVDFTPHASPAGATPVDEAASTRPAGVEVSKTTPSPEPHVEPDAGVTADPDSAYRELESTAIGKARELAQRPDVKGLLKLRADLVKRDQQLGRQRPAEMERMLAEILRLTDQARAAQLERDRREFLKEKRSP